MKRFYCYKFNEIIDFYNIPNYEKYSIVIFVHLTRI